MISPFSGIIWWRSLFPTANTVNASVWKKSENYSSVANGLHLSNRPRRREAAIGHALTLDVTAKRFERAPHDPSFPASQRRAQVDAKRPTPTMPPQTGPAPLE